MKRYAPCLAVLLIGVFFVLSTARVALADENSHFVGRLLGTVQPLPGFFRSNVTREVRNQTPEFRGFRIVNSKSGRRINIRPDNNGFFSNSLEPGNWVFERNRRDRPSRDIPAVLQIMTFDVPERSLANLGTIRIVLEGDPSETLALGRRRDQGTYIYTYTYERGEGEDDFTWPLDNLKRRNSAIFEKFRNNIVDIKEPITAETDTSRFVIRVHRR